MACGEWGAVSEATFTVICKGCGAEARNLNLVGLFTVPDLCPTCQAKEASE